MDYLLACELRRPSSKRRHKYISQTLMFRVTRDVQRKWTMRIAHWGQILTQLSIVFEGRVKLND